MEVSSLYFAICQYCEFQHPRPQKLRRLKVTIRYQEIIFCVTNDSVGNFELFIRTLHKNGLSNLAVFACVVLNLDKSHEDESVKRSRSQELSIVA